MQDKRTALVNATKTIVDFYQTKGCPCAFPRFLQAITFFHQNYNTGPVSFLESELLIVETFKPERNVYKAHSAGYGVQTEFYFCKVCGSEFDYLVEQYNINMTVGYLTFSELKAAPIGKPVSTPFPYYCGFSFLDEKDVKKIKKDFYQVEDVKEYIKYMTEM